MRQVDSDDGGGVSLQEFEAWFLANQRQQNLCVKKPAVMTHAALADNLDKMVHVSAGCPQCLAPLSAQSIPASHMVTLMMSDQSSHH